MESISVFLDTPKFADFWGKNIDVSRTQGTCQGAFLPPLPPSVSSPEKSHPE